MIFYPITPLNLDTCVQWPHIFRGIEMDVRIESLKARHHITKLDFTFYLLYVYALILI